MRRRGTVILLAATATVLSSCGLSLQSLPKIGGISGPTYTLRATFANVVNLPDNAQVRVGAFSVGFVSKIGIQDFRAVVTMKIKKSTVLPAGTTAQIGFDTPLGEDFVQLFPPTGAAANGARLSDGAAIPEQDTVTAPSVEDAFAALGDILNGGGINQLQTIITQTNLALYPNRSKIRQLLENLNATVTSFAQNTPAIDNALTAMANLSKTLNQDSTIVARGIKAFGPAASVLAQNNAQFDQLIKSLVKLSGAANSILDASRNGTVQTVQALQPLLTQLVSVQQQLGPALGAVYQLERLTPRAAPGNYLQLAINATIKVPPVPPGVGPVQKVTVDPPEPTESYSQSGIAIMIEDGLP